jgi:hypothetical protein
VRVYLNLPGIVSMHYEDQINQAVGRNRGFRHSTTQTTTTEVSQPVRRSSRSPEVEEDGVKILRRLSTATCRKLSDDGHYSILEH